MSAEAWALGEVKTAVHKASDENRNATAEELRAEVGIGHDDLAEVLSTLRERGEVVEDAPGEWRRPYDDERTAPDRSDDAAEDVSEGGAPAPGRAPARVAEEQPTSIVTLTMAVAAALDAETMGKLVEAGIAEANDERREFVLRIVP